MIARALSFTACAALLTLPCAAMAEFLRTDYGALARSLGGRLDFEARGAPSEPGTAIDTIIAAHGIRVGESLAGQRVVRRDGPPPRAGAAPGLFDGLEGAPTGLRVRPGPPGRNMALARHRGLGSVALYPLGPLGFPHVGALGEGAVAIVFEADQHAFGFRLHAGYADPLGTRPHPGTALLRAYARDGTPLWAEEITLTPGVMELAWQGDAALVAGFTLVADDPGGYALDDVLFSHAAPLG